MRFSNAERDQVAVQVSFLLFAALVAVALFWLTSCSAMESNGGDGGPDTIIMADPLNPGTWETDPVEIADVVIENDTARLEVRYSGGCVEHTFQLVATNYWLESLPVQLHALLSHDDHDDACDAFLSDTLEFELTPMKDAFRQAYGADDGRILVRFVADSIQASVLYEF